MLEQFPNLKLFDKFLTESDTFLNRCLGDEKKHYHDNLLQVEMIKAREAKMVPQVAAHSATMSPHRLSGVEYFSRYFFQRMSILLELIENFILALNYNLTRYY